MVKINKTKAVGKFLTPAVPSEREPDSFELHCKWINSVAFNEWYQNTQRYAEAKSIDESYAEYVKGILTKQNEQQSN